MPIRLTGEVRISCSVLIFRSSEKLFIVSSGTRTMNMNITNMKYEPTLLPSPAMSVHMEKIKAFSAKNTAMNTYPIGDVK